MTSGTSAGSPSQAKSRSTSVRGSSAGQSRRSGERVDQRMVALETRLATLEKAQERRFTELMKFSILRHISVLSLLLEQGSAPARVMEHGRALAHETAERIAAAETMDEVRELDLALQQELRQVILAYGKP